MAFDEYKSTHKVNAEQIEEERSVITPNGPVSAKAGQWEVRYPDGNVQVVDDEQFTAAFKGEAAEEEAVAEPEAKEEESEPTPNSEESSGEKSAEQKTLSKPRSSSR